MNGFISKFVNYLRHDLEFSESKINKFKHAIRKYMNDVVGGRDELHSIIIRDFRKPSNLAFYLMNDDLWLGSKEEKVFVGVKKPNWSMGIKHLSKDEDVVEIISWFLHFSEQYVMRAFHVNVIGAINLIYDKDCDFMGEQIITQMDSSPLNDSYRSFISHNLRSNNSRRSTRSMKYWISTINSFDPIINRIIYNFNKAISLRDNLFWEEAIVSCDKTVNVIEQFYQRIQPTDNQLVRKEMTMFFLDEKAFSVLERLYELRCYFGAHPSSSKWWDFAEIYEEELTLIFDVIRTLIMCVFRHECRNRIQKYNYKELRPSDWLRLNLEELFQTCWFSDLP